MTLLQPMMREMLIEGLSKEEKKRMKEILDRKGRDSTWLERKRMPRVKKIDDPSITPDGIIRSSLRLLFMKSREKGAATRRDKNTCQTCGAKGSVAKGKEVKTECHHTIGTEGRDIDWQRIYAVIREELLCSSDELTILCKPCHLALHGKTPKPRRKK